MRLPQIFSGKPRCPNNTICFADNLTDFVKKNHRSANMADGRFLSGNQTQSAYTIDINRFSVKILGQYYFGTPIAFAEGGVDENKQNETLVRRTES